MLFPQPNVTVDTANQEMLTSATGTCGLYHAEICSFFEAGAYDVYVTMNGEPTTYFPWQMLALPASHNASVCLQESQQQVKSNGVARPALEQTSWCTAHTLIWHTYAAVV